MPSYQYIFQKGISIRITLPIDGVMSCHQFWAPITAEAPASPHFMSCSRGTHGFLFRPNLTQVGFFSLNATPTASGYDKLSVASWWYWIGNSYSSEGFALQFWAKVSVLGVERLIWQWLAASTYTASVKFWCCLTISVPRTRSFLANWSITEPSSIKEPKAFTPKLDVFAHDLLHNHDT